jgi:hypothetical protein
MITNREALKCQEFAKKIDFAPCFFPTCTKNVLPRKFWKDGDLKIGGKIINTVKYADDLVLLAREETVLQDIISKLIEIGRCYGMEMNVEKTKV